MEHEIEDHDLGLAADLPLLMDRRRMLGLLAGAGLGVLIGCGRSEQASTSTTSAAATGTTGGTAAASPAGSSAGCAAIPEETAGPFPGDGSNGPDALTQSGVVRSDITRSFGSSSTVAEGVPLTINLTIQNTAENCAAYAGAAVYLWHCDREGGYSMYSQAVRNENYLRGVQEADGNGSVTFKTIFPGAYSGRWPHMHFEVYPSLDKATSASGKVSTSQLALPEPACKEVYATEGYEQSVRNLAQTSLARDNVFRDGYDKQLASMTGTIDSGLTAGLIVQV